MNTKIITLAAGLVFILVANCANAQTTTERSASRILHGTEKLMRGMERCYGISKAGKNDCTTPIVRNCVGAATKDGDPNAWIYLPKGTCNRIVGGSLTPGS